MEHYNGCFIDGAPKMIHPFDRSWYPAGDVFKSGRLTSVIEIARVEMPSFMMEMKEFAEYFGLELSRIVVDECLIG